MLRWILADFVGRMKREDEAEVKKLRRVDHSNDLIITVMTAFDAGCRKQPMYTRMQR